jgi:Domain of unknown function (DUF4157)
MLDEDLIRDLLRSSRARSASVAVPADTRAWSHGFRELLPKRFWIHDDLPAQRAAARLGCHAFALRDRIVLGAFPESMRGRVLRHELVHLAQMQLALRGNPVASVERIEAEADRLAAAPLAGPIECAADPDSRYGFWWVAAGVGIYILLRPSVANAPAPGDRLRPSPPLPKIVLESVAIFAIPGGAFALGGRLGIGLMGSMAFAGASATVSSRVVEDVFNGAPSSPLLYLFDATTGAVIGFVVPGGIRLIGIGGTMAFDRLATWGLVRADIALTEMLAEAAAAAPLDAQAAQKILQAEGLSGRVSQWWLTRRGLVVLYRGQGMATERILSPLARSDGIAASEELVARMRLEGLTDPEIAGYTARWHTEPVPSLFAPPNLGGLPLGSVGIPTSRIPGIAANFGEEGIIYIIRVPSSSAIAPMGWQGLALESEHVILNSVPPGGVVKTIPASRISPILINESGLIVPGR